MSVQHMTWAYKQELEPGPKFVLVTLANFADGTGSCFPGQERLAKMTGFSLRSVRNHVLTLEAAGLIQRSGRRRDDGMKTSDVYQLLMSPAEVAGEVTAESPAESAPESPAKPAGKKQESPAESAATHRQNFPTSPAKPAGRNRGHPTAETPSPTQIDPTLPAESAGSTVRLTVSNNHQIKEPPTPLKKSKPKKQKFDPLKVELPVSVSADIWADFVAHRNELGRALTPTATKQLIRNLEKFGPTANQALRNSIANSWTGVFEPKDQQPAATKPDTRQSSSLDQYEHLRSGGGS